MVDIFLKKVFNIHCRTEKYQLEVKNMIILLFMIAMVLLYIIGANVFVYFLIKSFLCILPILIVYWTYVYFRNHKKTGKQKESKMTSDNGIIIFITIILTCIVAATLMVNAL